MEVQSTGLRLANTSKTLSSGRRKDLVWRPQGILALYIDATVYGGSGTSSLKNIIETTTV